MACRGALHTSPSHGTHTTTPGPSNIKFPAILPAQNWIRFSLSRRFYLSCFCDKKWWPWYKGWVRYLLQYARWINYSLPDKCCSWYWNTPLSCWRPALHCLTKHWSIIGLLPWQRPWRRPSTDPALGVRFAWFAGVRPRLMLNPSLEEEGYRASNTNHRAIVGSMLGQRLRRWPNIVPTKAQCLVCGDLKLASPVRCYSSPIWH